MNKISEILITGIIVGAILFIGFFISSYTKNSILGIPSLEEFISMIGLIVLFISGFFLISLKTNKC